MKGKKRWLAALMAGMLVTGSPTGITAWAEEAAAQQQVQIVLTLGADLTEEQKASILQYFGVSTDQVQTLTITNADERAQLGDLISEEKIGTQTLSCAVVRPTSKGGIQVKTANLNYVTSNMIASTLSTSGVYNCEVLTAAPFDVSGTGALTGVMMAYESASGDTLDEEKKDLANEELVITGEISDSVGQDQATLVVNDIKIHIVRDQVTDEQEITEVVDEVVETTQQAAETAAQEQGQEAPAKLGEVEHQKLYSFGQKFSRMGYQYKDMQSTLERVTYNVSKKSGIDDPLTDTFSTITDDSGLSPDSILLNTDDSVMGEDAIIDATNSVAIGDHPAEEIEVYTGDVTLTEAGGVKAENFISGTDLVAYKDVNGSYALMDLNGNMLTEAKYTRYLSGSRYSYPGYVIGQLNDGSEQCGVFASDGSIAVPFEYDSINMLSELWAIGYHVTAGTESDYDGRLNGEYVQISSADVYYLANGDTAPIATITREQIADASVSGDYINLQDQSGVITTYDSAFTAVRNPDSLYNFSGLSYDSTLADILSSQTGYSVYSFHGNYAKVTDYNIGKTGVIDRYGNIIVPLEFENVDYNYSDESWMAGGYFAVKSNGKFAYTTAGGANTVEFDVPSDSVISYGMSAKYEADDGSITLLAGDGTITELGTAYSYVSSIKESKGMLWTAEKDGGYDLIDWHGNVLLSGSSDYSVSANGNYVIAQNGYTSSTLYQINDASPVALAEGAGGAAELETTVLEGASLTAYTGDPELKEEGELKLEKGVSIDSFLEGTDLALATKDQENYGLVDMNGEWVLPDEYIHYGFDYQDGWIIVEKRVGEEALYGVVSPDGAELLPCEYQIVEILNENWIVGYTLEETDSEDAEYSSFDGTNYNVASAVVYHIGEEELNSVSLTREQIADAEAEGEYLNVEDRTSGLVTTYDSSFTAVASVNSVYDFDAYSSTAVLARQLKDSTGMYVSNEDFPDGYSAASLYDSESGESSYGVIDMSGNVVVPTEYDRIDEYSLEDGWHIWANGYFAVELDDKVGYVTDGGTVTCEIKYDKTSFMNYGMAGFYQETDGTYTLVAADGTETKGFAYLYSWGNGLIWGAQDDAGNISLIDWHGNVLLDKLYDLSGSDAGKYVLAQSEGDDAVMLYTIDGGGTDSKTEEE